MQRDRRPPGPRPHRRDGDGPTAADLARQRPPDAISPWVRLRSATPHPFIFERMVGGVDPLVRPGDVVTVYDKNGNLFGRGLFNPRSRIAVRMLTHRDVPIDDAFWRSRLELAVGLRRLLGLDAVTDAYRLVHAEGDGLSGLIAERYADCLVFEFFSLGMFQRAGQFAAILREILGPPTSLDRPQRAAADWRIVVRADPQIEQIEGFRADRADAAAAESRNQNPISRPEGVSATVIREHGVRYRVDMASGHKTGFFCDQRDNRRRLAAICGGANVLDLCCYTAGFGLCAKVLGGARDVTSVDLDEKAIAVARDNVNLNQARIDLVQADAFVYLRQMIAAGRKYDVLVLDPPKFATSRDEYEDALARYYDLNVLAVQAVRPGGQLLTCSCSGLVSPDIFVETVFRAVRRTGRVFQMIDLTGPGGDHPVMMNCPESAYLKALWGRVL